MPPPPKRSLSRGGAINQPQVNYTPPEAIEPQDSAEKVGYYRRAGAGRRIASGQGTAVRRSRRATVPVPRRHRLKSGISKARRRGSGCAGLGFTRRTDAQSHEGFHPPYHRSQPWRPDLLRGATVPVQCQRTIVHRRADEAHAQGHTLYLLVRLELEFRHPRRRRRCGRARSLHGRVGSVPPSHEAEQLLESNQGTRQAASGADSEVVDSGVATAYAIKSAVSR